jgi:hypothetical protein
MAKLTKLEEWKLRFFKEKFGSMRSTEALALAINAEQIAKETNPFDPAFSHFKTEQRIFESYAEFLEKEENQ